MSNNLQDLQDLLAQSQAAQQAAQQAIGAKLDLLVTALTERQAAQATLPATVAADAVEVEAPFEIAAMRTKRLERRAKNKRGGLTSDERKALAAANREALNAAAKKSKAAYDRVWDALVAKHKAAHPGI